MSKFVEKNKMSKKAQKELAKKQRGTWQGVNPVTRVSPDTRRKRLEKAILAANSARDDNN